MVRRPLATLTAAAALVLTAGSCAEAIAADPARPATNGHTSAGPGHRELWCFDATSSVPPPFRARLLGHAADVIADTARGPTPSTIFYLRKTVSRSYPTEAELATVRLPAVPEPPTPPVLSTNPFDKPKNDALLRHYDDEKHQWDADLDRARATAAAAATRVRAIDIPEDTTGTDLYGCPLHAPALLGSAGERHLVVGSDFVPNGRQQDVELPAGALTGVQVTLVPYCADLAGVCQQNVQAFADRMGRAGATDITVLDPQDL